MANLRVGRRQHLWLYGGPNCWESKPYRFKPAQGSPPAVLRNLIAKGLMWAERREVRNWMPRKQEWSGRHDHADYWCGLTPKGWQLIEDRKNESTKAFEYRKQREETA